MSVELTGDGSLLQRNREMPGHSHADDRRKVIVTAAMKAFDAHGYAATTMDMIAEEAGVSKGSLYNYFQNKDDLFRQVFTDALAGEEEQVERLLSASTSASHKLGSLIDYIFGRLRRYVGVSGLMMEFWATAARPERGPRLSERLIRVHRRWKARIESVLAEGIQKGEFRQEINPKIGASLIWSTVNGILVLSTFDSDAQITPDYLASLKRGFVAALTTWSARGGSPQ